MANMPILLSIRDLGIKDDDFLGTMAVSHDARKVYFSVVVSSFCERRHLGVLTLENGKPKGAPTFYPDHSDPLPSGHRSGIVQILVHPNLPVLYLATQELGSDGLPVTSKLLPVQCLSTDLNSLPYLHL